MKDDPEQVDLDDDASKSEGLPSWGKSTSARSWETKHGVVKLDGQAWLAREGRGAAQRRHQQWGHGRSSSYISLSYNIKDPGVLIVPS
jgi:hypothetical protein